jgi:hypothetical protein
MYIRRRSQRLQNKNGLPKDENYFRLCIRNGELLEQTIGDHRICVKYECLFNEDTFTIKYPFTPELYNITFTTIHDVSKHHAQFLDIDREPDPWQTFKIVGWNTGLTVYPTDSIDKLHQLPKEIMEKDLESISMRETYIENMKREQETKSMPWYYILLEKLGVF